MSRPSAGRRRPPGRGRSLARLAALVALGGTVGTAARASLESAFPAGDGGWPWTTFGINVAGSLVLGALLESLLRGGEDAGWRRAVRLGCGTGLLGGFTTYSTFVLEVDQLLRGGDLGVGVLYALASVVAGLAAAGAGVALAAGRARARARGVPGPAGDGGTGA